MGDDDWDDDYDDTYPADECDHEDATVDILTGEMTCHCGYRRWLSGVELEREDEFQARMMEAYFLEAQADSPDTAAPETPPCAINSAGVADG